MRPRLRVVIPAPELAPTYATVPASALADIDAMAADARRVSATVSGSFITSAKRDDAVRQLANIEIRARSARVVIERGR